MALEGSTPVPAAGEELIELLLGSGQNYLDQGDLDRARRCASRALELAVDASARERGPALRLLAKALAGSGDLTQAKVQLDECLRIQDNAKEYLEAASTLCDLADLMKRMGDPEEARRLLHEGLTRSSAAPPGAVRARILIELGMVQRARGEYEDALGNLSESLRIMEGLGDRPAHARVLVKMGNLLQKVGRPAEALEHQRRALKTWESLHDRLEIGKVLNNIGGALLDQGEYDEASACLDQARVIFQELGDKERLAHALSNLALLQVHRGETRRAEQMLRESLEIREDLKDRQGQANCLNNLAHVAMTAGRFEEAIGWADRSIAIRMETKREEGLTKPWLNIAQAYLELERLPEAEDAGRAVRELAERSGSLEEMIGSWLFDASLALRASAPEQAVELARRALEASSKEGYRSTCGQALQILGEARLLLDELDPARESLLEAEATFRDLGAHFSLATNRLALGQLFRRVNLPEAAAERLRRAVEGFDRMENRLGQWRALVALADAEASISPAQSRRTLDAAKAIARGMNRVDLEERTEAMRTSICGPPAQTDGAPSAVGTLLLAESILRERVPEPQRISKLFHFLTERFGLTFLLYRPVEEEGEAIGPTSVGPVSDAGRGMANRCAPETLQDHVTGKRTGEQVSETLIVSIPVRDRENVHRGVLVAAGPLWEGNAAGTHPDIRTAGDWGSVLGVGAGLLGLILAPLSRSPTAEEPAEVPSRVAPPAGRTLRMAFEGIVGASDPMQEIFEAIAKVAPTDMSVLIEGESGTGKELVARAIHARSLRANGPLAAISCPSIPKDLIESELFGHERGAFTGAYASRPGRIEAADHGTLFLDEIGDIAEATQSKLLRFLQEREFQRVGGRTSIRVDVRLVAATSRDLRQEILAGRFREDLLYRLNVASLRLPALRDRIEDLPLLVDTFLCKLAGRRGRRVLGITDEVHRLLMDYPWPGNIRELQNVLEYLVAMSHDDRITAEHVPENVRKAAKQAAFERSQKEREKDRERELPTLRSGETLDARLLSLEGELIRGALERCGGNQSRAARMLGITVTRIRLRMRRYGLETEESRESEGLAAEGSSKPLRRRSRRKRARGPAGERNV